MPAAPGGSHGGPAPARDAAAGGPAEPTGRLPPMRRRVTFSRNVTLSLSRSCVSHCKYCAFATHRPHLHEPDEVERLIDRAARRGVKELLVLTGDDPASAPGVRERLAALGFDDFVAYVVWCCERALERGLLPHTNLGALARDDLARLRARDRVAGADARVDARRPRRPPGLADEGPGAAAADDPRRGRAADPVHERDPRRDRRDARTDRVAALEALAAVHAEHGHLQEVILQNYVPHRRYYGEEPADIATEAAEAYWRTGLHDGPRRARRRRGPRR